MVTTKIIERDPCRDECHVVDIEWDQYCEGFSYRGLIGAVTNESHAIESASEIDAVTNELRGLVHHQVRSVIRINRMLRLPRDHHRVLRSVYLFDKTPSSTRGFV
jgi:hypothetical protein